MESTYAYAPTNHVRLEFSSLFLACSFQISGATAYGYGMDLCMVFIHKLRKQMIEGITKLIHAHCTGQPPTRFNLVEIQGN
jgi:hypothetical protein